MKFLKFAKAKSLVLKLKINILSLKYYQNIQELSIL